MSTILPIIAIVILIGGLGFIFNYVASVQTIKYLKNKQANSSDSATDIDEVGFVKYNWILLQENSSSIIRKTTGNKYYLDEQNLAAFGNRVKFQLMAGIFQLLMGIALLFLSLVYSFNA